uniref:NADH-ubiquinone oxidoreductase chain 6 n=1 Tax=Ligia oceanica TaxID=96856 RepID=Q09TF2_LIGOC|nr:NADH dehydrogenase subunit 6 [Ligia oceanica]
MSLILWLFTAMMFTAVTTPHWMLFLLIIQALLSSIIMSMLKMSLWFSYILFLVFLGGMLVVFCYVASLAPKEVVEEASLLSMLVCINISSVVMASLMIMSTDGVVYSELLEGQAKDFIFGVKWMFSLESASLYIYSVLYLLLALICAANLMKVGGKPLRLLE